ACARSCSTPPVRRRSGARPPGRWAWCATRAWRRTPGGWPPTLASPPASPRRGCCGSTEVNRPSPCCSVWRRTTSPRWAPLPPLAAARLQGIDPGHARKVLGKLLRSRDAKVRELGIVALFRLPSGEHVKLLADRLDDEHPAVRVLAREALHLLADPNPRRGLR